MKDQLFWQEENNATWLTDKKMICDICGKRIEEAYELKTRDFEEGFFTCRTGNNNCFYRGVNILFSKNIEHDHIMLRSVKYVCLGKTKNKKREPIGLAKRFAVMKRDFFQCVSCGKSGKDARLEIDHIIPVSDGGSSKMNNLQTLCFECNRGKGANNV